MGHKKGYTLLELISVIVILGILATLGIANYSTVREHTLDKDAVVGLKILRAAEHSYRVETGTYYPSIGSEANMGSINTNLGVLLPSDVNRVWNYSVWSTGCVQATRNVGGGRSWFLTINDADDTPDSGASCP